MQLLHVCIGKVRTHRINGQDITTAYLKAPVEGPWRINPGGLEGNEIAVHTDPVYAYSQDGYEFWAQRLGVGASEWGPGTFAENLTFSTLAEESLHVGDVVALGPEVRLVVAGPRVPCFKLTWRLGQPESFIREFAVSGHTGVYFGVLQPGVVTPGDELRVLQRAEGNPTVAETAQLIFGDETPSEEALEHALSLPTLSATAALALRSRLYRTRDILQTRRHRWSGWREFEIDSMTAESADTLSLRLRSVDGAPIAGFRAGQFLTVRLPREAGDEVIRTWSCSDFDRETATYRITVKREPKGAASSWLHRHARVGMHLDVRAPAGRFVLDRSGFKPVVLIAAGIGITPLLSMLKSHADRGARAPAVYIVHCVRDGAHHPLKAEIDAIVATRPDFKAHYVYSAPRATDRLGVDFHQAGRFAASDLYALLADNHLIHCGRRIDLPWFESDIYLCGPAAFQDELRRTLIEAGAPADRVFFEHFSVARGESSGAVVEQAQVSFARSGKETTWDDAEALSLLELAERAGLSPEAGCRMGICQSCQCRLLEGQVHYDSAPSGLPAPDVVLACIAKPGSTRVVLDL